MTRQPGARVIAGCLSRSAARSSGVGLAGSGMFILNPPYTLHAQLLEVLPWLTEVLGQYDGANYLLEEKAA